MAPSMRSLGFLHSFCWPKLHDKNVKSGILTHNKPMKSQLHFHENIKPLS